MKFSELVSGKIYKVRPVVESIYVDGDNYAEFSRLSSSRDWAIFHPPGEPDMQSCVCLSEKEIISLASEKILCKINHMYNFGCCEDD